MTEQTVFIVDDELAMQESLAWMIESVGLKTCAFSSAQLFLDYYSPEQEGCLILDVRMPGLSGPELQSILTKNNIMLPIIFISGHGDIPLAVRAMKCGAMDFLTKPCNEQVLLESINKALRVDQEQRAKNVKASFAKDNYHQLTRREKQVMSHVVAGKLNKIISAELNISLKTVEAHRASVMRKMKVKSLPELVELSIRFQLLEETAIP